MNNTKLICPPSPRPLLTKITTITAIILAITFVLSGCGGGAGGGAGAPLGTITLNLRSSARAVVPESATLDKITYTVKLQGATTITAGPTVPGQQAISISVPPGPYTITVTAWLEGSVYAEGVFTGIVEVGKTNSVPVKMSVSGNIFTSLAEFGTWLLEQPQNGPGNPYNVKLNMPYGEGPKVVEAIDQAGRYVNLDISGNNIPDIANGSFDSLIYLCGITLPNTITIIDASAFYGCIYLKSIIIPASVTTIGNSAFLDCTSLTTVTFATGSNITSANFGSNAFPQAAAGGDNLETLYTDANNGGAGTYVYSTSSPAGWSKL